MPAQTSHSTRTPKKTRRVSTPAADACCETGLSVHPDHTAYLPRLNRVSGQITGIEKMISDRRYCVDILVQFRAVMAALRSIEVNIFETHLQHCVSSAFLSKDKKEVEKKIRELSELLTRRTSL